MAKIIKKIWVSPKNREERKKQRSEILEAATSLMSTKKHGFLYPYEFLGEEGEGSFSKVFKVLAPILVDGEPNPERDDGKYMCALKLAHPHVIHGKNPWINQANRNRLKREFACGDAIFTRLREKSNGNRRLEDHLIRPYTTIDFDGVHNNIFWNFQGILSEYIQGHDLTQYIKKLDQKQVIELGRTLAKVLYEAHELGIIHRDVKPSNIVIPSEEKEPNPDKIILAMLADLGLARRWAEIGVTYADYKNLVGSPGSASFEQLDPNIHNTVDHRTDIYSLGATIYRLTTGHRTYSEQDMKMTMHYGADLPNPKSMRYFNSRIDSDLDSLIMQSLSEEKEDRPQSMRIFNRELGKIKRKLSRVR